MLLNQIVNLKLAALEAAFFWSETCQYDFRQRGFARRPDCGADKSIQFFGWLAETCRPAADILVRNLPVRESRQSQSRTNINATLTTDAVIALIEFHLTQRFSKAFRAEANTPSSMESIFSP